MKLFTKYLLKCSKSKFSLVKSLNFHRRGRKPDLIDKGGAFLSLFLFFNFNDITSVLRRGESLSSEKSEKFSPARPSDRDLSRLPLNYDLIGIPNYYAGIRLFLLVVGPEMLLGNSLTRGLFKYYCYC